MSSLQSALTNGLRLSRQAAVPTVPYCEEMACFQRQFVVQAAIGSMALTT